MLKLLNKKIQQGVSLRLVNKNTFTTANIGMITAKKGAMIPPVDPKNPPEDEEGPRYLKFFRAADEMLYDELVFYDINQTNYYVSRVLASDFFTFSSKLRTIRVLNTSPVLITNLIKKIVEAEGKVHLDIEAFSCLDYLLMKRNRNQLDSFVDVIYYNKYIIDSFREYSLMRRIDIIMVLAYIRRHDDNYVKEVLSELKTKIHNNEIWNELNFYWDYVSLLKFLATYLPTFVQEHEIKPCYNPVFLNRLMQEINTKFSDLRHMSRILDHIGDLLTNSQVSYIMYKFLRTLFLDK